MRLLTQSVSGPGFFFPPPSIFFQEGDFQSETIRFGTERMTIDSWVRKRTYDAFREFVGSGMNYHLQVPYLLFFNYLVMMDDCINVQYVSLPDSKLKCIVWVELEEEDEAVNIFHTK